MPASSLVSKRCVLFIGDIDAAPPKEQHETFRQNLLQFAKTWDTRGSLTPFDDQPGAKVSSWRISTKGADWNVATEYRLWDWSRVPDKADRSFKLRQIWLAIRAFVDFVLSGTCWRYFRMGPRFAFLFVAPVLFLALGLLSLWWLSTVFTNLGVPSPLVVAVAVIVLPTIVLGRTWLRGYVSWTANLWIQLWRIVHLKSPDLATRLGLFSEDLATVLKSRKFDEVLVVGHGLGTTFLPIILDRAFWGYPEFGKSGEKLSLLTISPQLLAVGLHREAGWLTGPLSRISRDRMVYWLELQARNDALSFAGKNGVEVLTESKGRPDIKIMEGAKSMGGPKKNYLESLLARHRQLLAARNERSTFDLYMAYCGPFDLRTFGRTPERVLEPVGSQVSASPTS